jgi:hypothetical protein
MNKENVKMLWNSKYLGVSRDGTGYIEYELGHFFFTLDFTWKLKNYDDYQERIVIDVDFEDIHAYDSLTDTVWYIDSIEYHEYLTEMIEDRVNECADEFGMRTMEDIKDLLNNYE